ncbi:Pectinesterase, catalytic, partial [Dillenia turbinata]
FWVNFHGGFCENTYITWDDMEITWKWPGWYFRNNFDQSRVLIVNKYGFGHSETVQGAVDMVPENNSKRVKIYISPGIYREKVIVPSTKPYISFIGSPDDPSITKITWHDKASDKIVINHTVVGEIGTVDTGSVTIYSDYFVATGITFENTVIAVEGEEGAQAVALRLSGDKAMLYKVRIVGSQDTLLDDRGSHYFYQCYIEGFVDFIFGTAKSLYQDCHLRSTAKHTGSIAAHHRDSPDDTGFSFINCTIDGTGNIYLGRAWGGYSRVVFSYCNISNIIIPSGWTNWDKPLRYKLLTC